MRLAFCCLILAITSMSAVAHADDVHLYAAGSLRAALTDIGAAFTAKTGHCVVAKFGPSGVLEKEIAGGAKADVFASANMDYPQALNRSNNSGPVLRFARNKLCALVKPRLAVDSTTLLDHMLDPAIKLGTSTPNSDPSGDYAFEVFRKADTIRPGARAVLESKALKLTGTAESAVPPAGLPVYGWHIAEGRADIFLAYCTATAEARKHYPSQQIVQLPEALAVGADYGLTVIKGAPAAAEQFSWFILSPAGQNILIGYGFAPGQTGPSQTER
ncbi:MAG: molybdate ABC transporter substrate-binding protein [Xanthobacteraceae bacterium]